MLLPAVVGGAEGKLWWFKDTSIVPRLNEIPLTERVEQTVYRKLHQMGKVTGGYWLLKPEIQQRIRQHNEVIAILAVVGKKQGYDIWIGKREQHEKDSGLIATGKTLNEYMSVKHLRIDNAANQDVIENIDLIWIKDRRVKAIFEVESTTSMTSALMRGSNIDREVDKFMVFPLL